MCCRLTRLTQLRRDTDGVTSVQLVAVLTTSACTHHQFLQRQPVPIISSYNVSLCPSSVPSTSEYFLLIVFERECSYIMVTEADLWRLSQTAVLFRFWFFFLVCCSGSGDCQWRLSRQP